MVLRSKYCFSCIADLSGTIAVQVLQLKSNFLLLITNINVLQVELCDDDEFLVLACDGIW